MRKAILVLALVTTSHPIIIQASIAMAQTHPDEYVLSEKPAALELSKLLNNEAILIGDDDDDIKAAEFAVQIFGSLDELAAIEAEFPGIGKKVADAIMPIVNQSMRDRMPVIQDRQAKLFAANFEQAELEKLRDFYASPTGQKLINGVTQNIEPTAIKQEIEESQNLEISPDAVLEDISATVPAIVETFDANDLRALANFGKTGLLQKIQSISPQIQKNALTWLNEYVPGEEAKIDALIGDIFKQYETGAEG